jgi:hypothetical protein
MRCSLPPHREALSFNTYAEYEVHYKQAHSNRCVECDRNFPSEHLLNLHIDEQHDTFIALKREKGEHTYACFVEGCERKCRTPSKRARHLIDKHMYPNNYFFKVTRDGIDGRESLLMEAGHRRRRSSTATSTIAASKAASRRHSLRQTHVEKPDAKAEGREASSSQTLRSDSEEEGTSEQKSEPADTEMEDLAGAMSSLQFVPPSVRFGRGRGKSGFARN